MALKIFNLIFLILLQSCASLGPNYTSNNVVVPKGKTFITVYRPWKFAGSAGDPYVCLDNKVVGEYYNGSFYNLEITPEEHYISWGMMGVSQKMEFISSLKQVSSIF